MMTVYDLEIGQKATIHSISGDIRLAKRLFALGCISGTEISVKKVAPFGDPMVINFRGLDLALRKNDAKNITVK